MKKRTFLLFFLGLLAFQLNAQLLTKKPFVLGETLEINSVQLGEKRSLNIYLPAGYNPDSARRYPVIYLLDGSAGEDFVHVAGLVQFWNMMQMMPPTIVVGIGNVDRRRDFTYPSTDAQDQKDFPTTGGSAKFIAFLEKELQPSVNQQYKTRGKGMLIGQSLGGLLATEVLLTKSELFDQYVIVSPSLWWDKQSLSQNAAAMFAKQPDSPRQVFVAVGEEGKVMTPLARKLSETLKKSGKKNLSTHFAYMPDEDHATILHLAVYKAFKWFYPAQK
ncbi:hypothetical protein SAMN05421780_10877 [Flexibacter flexilis DSM 6793]|uniref:Esterase n=1 Tax=Flexibacter flexilis DSM 6793 TaxID=927664 RepID=A0A1I1LDF9_9BACT|nr:alpha/beta hydrolase-fold protein [Flexibacter flexilis]SFC68413.1 hypothetical protein SAMN05421780_10877 [Flexibacter flexilis DSM 6793]